MSSSNRPGELGCGVASTGCGHAEPTVPVQALGPASQGRGEPKHNDVSHSGSLVWASAEACFRKHCSPEAQASMIHGPQPPASLSERKTEEGADLKVQTQGLINSAGTFQDLISINLEPIADPRAI